ncbi:MAG: alpha/beta fold hydrolase [Pedobacter sp.]|nr:alpha/beta fold hydrolase [Pedobacter sp.]
MYIPFFFSCRRLVPRGLLAFFLLLPLLAQAADKALFDEILQGQEAVAGLKRHEAVIDGQKIFYLDNENKSGRPLLLIHGFGDSSMTWVQFARRFKHENVRIIAPDLLGFGQSPKPVDADYRFSAQAKRMFALMQQLGVEKFHVAGNSMGGGIAGEMAATQPQKILSLTLIDAAGVHYKPADLDRAMLAGRNMLVLKSRQDFEALLALVFVNKPPVPEPVTSYLAERAVQDWPLHERIVRDALFDDVNFLLLKMDAITSPTLVLWGEKDRLLSVDNTQVFKKFIKGSQVVILPDVGHAPQVEVPNESSAEVLKFIDALAPLPAAAATK